MTAQTITTKVRQLHGYTEFLVAGQELVAVDAPQLFIDILVDEAFDRWGQGTAERLVEDLF